MQASSLDVNNLSIRTARRRGGYRLLAAAVLAATALAGTRQETAAATPANASALATADQNAVETLALKILASPVVKKQEEETKKLLLADPAAATPDGGRTLQEAVDELAFATALSAANGDPTRPKIVWAFTAPRTWFGHKVPGSRWGMDNPDNAYRFIPVDGTSKYEISVRPSQPGPVQFSFLIYDSFVGENGKRKNLDAPIAALRDRDIKVEADGTFTITVDSEPANGRANHLQTNADAKSLLVRNTFSDWETQQPLAVTIKRVGGPEPGKPASDTALAELAAQLLKDATDTLLGIKNPTPAGGTQSNVISKPFVRGGGWGFAATGNFKLANDEGLLVTLDPVGARYVGFDLTGPWLVSREHVHATGSLNNLQAHPNKDGTYTYVVAAKDPGVHNWLDTGGLHEGRILIRWQVLPETTQSADGAVRETKVVKLAELKSILPADTPSVSPVEREKLSVARASAYARRYAPQD